MTNKITMQVLTVLFIAALAAALYWSWGQTSRLQDLNNDLNSLNTKLEIKRDSLKKVITALKKEREGYVKLFNSSKDYEEAKKENTPEAYYEYVKSVGAQNFGDTRVMEEIIDKLNSLMNKEGYVQVKNSDGTFNFEEKEKLFKDYNFFQAKSDLNVRKGVIGSSDYSNVSRTGGIIYRNQIVNVLKTVKSGASEWALISYN